MPDYLKVDDFLMYDDQMSKKVGRLHDNLDALREQVIGLTSAFGMYVSETDKYRNETDKRLDSINAQLSGLRSEMADIKRTVSSLEQTVSQGFTLIFARLGITPP